MWKVSTLVSVVLSVCIACFRCCAVWFDRSPSEHQTARGAHACGKAREGCGLPLPLCGIHTRETNAQTLKQVVLLFCVLFVFATRKIPDALARYKLYISM